MGPLCPDLYELLMDRFGDVRVAHEGEELVAHPTIDPATGRSSWEFTQSGEQYFVNCPFCNDTRQRLAISYCYGQVDPLTMRAANWLAHCFNEECLHRDTPGGLDNRRALEDMIFGFVNRADRIGKYKTEPGVILEPQSLTAVSLPGRVITLDQLTGNHPAVRYLELRGYDASRLGSKLGVGYCVEADVKYPAARGRIIAPIIMDGVLVGWQGRYVGDLNWKGIPKYYNLPRMPKKLMLYNLDNAAHSRVVVVVESVTSVWKLGDAAVALLGKDITTQQQELIAQRWASRGALLVFILDPDAEDKAERYFRRLEQLFFGYEGGAAFRVTMPPGKDPGDFDRETVWAMIYSAGDRQCIDVSSYL
jgi:hypothetical protein